jgi:DNA-binding CsgD family transcriptional regulator
VPSVTHHEPGLDVTHALEEVSVPASVVDRDGRIRWQNRGSIELVGDRVGQAFSRAIAPEDVHVARTQFARKLLGEAQITEYDLTLLRTDGRRLRARVSAVPFWRDGEIVGTFGLAYTDRAGTDGEGHRAPDAAAPELTARQHETLALLAQGLGTAAIAERLGVAEETARNHIRGVLRQLGVHSRLEAVVRAHVLGLLPPPDGD